MNFKAAHNTYLHLLTENGIIGLTLYVLVLISVFYYASQAPFNEKVFLLTVLISIMLSQITLHTQIQKETWFALTMIILHSRILSRPTA